MSMTIRQVIYALIDAEDLDKECVIEVNKTTLPKDEGDWLQIDIEKVVNCKWGSVIQTKEGEKNEIH